MAYTWEGVPPDYGLYWSDEFNGSIGNYPSSSNWFSQTGATGWGNNELQNYTSCTANAQIVSDASAVDGKALAIIAIDTMPGNSNYSTVGRYTSARLYTLGLQSFQYGYVVARIRSPYGQGIHPTFWMMGTDIDTVGWPACGEMDIMENTGSIADQSTNHGSLRDGIDWSNIFTIPGGQLLHNDYNTFAVLWQPGQIQFYVDGNLYETVNSLQQTSGTWEFNKTFYFLLNIAVGGNWPGSPDATTLFPQIMYVDYVRAYTQGLPTPVPVSQSTWRVRCGGDDYTDSQGNLWQADTNFTGGLPAPPSTATGGTVLPSQSDHTLYEYERYGDTNAGTTLTYTFNVSANENYQVRMKFAENYWTATGKRQFNVAINGNTVLTNFDVFTDSGGQFIADDKVYDNIFSGPAGTITIVLSPGNADVPEIDAIQILPEFSTPPSPTCTYTTTPTPTPYCSVPLDSFAACSTVNRWGGGWYDYADAVTTIAPLPFSLTTGGYSGSSGCSDLISGTEDSNSGAYAGTGTKLNSAGTSVDLSSYIGVQFYAKGDGNTYWFQALEPGITDSDYFGRAFTASTTWTQVVLLFSNFHQRGFGAAKSFTQNQITNIQWTVINHGNFNLNIDKINLISASCPFPTPAYTNTPLSTTGQSPLDNVYVFPSLVNLSGTNDGVTFCRLPSHVSIKLFNMAGELVYAADTDITGGQFFIKLKHDQGGTNIASGTYIYAIIDRGKHVKIGKMAVIW